MTFFEQLIFWIIVVDETWGGTFLPAVAASLIALMVCAHLAVRDRKRRRP